MSKYSEEILRAKAAHPEMFLKLPSAGGVADKKATQKVIRDTMEDVISSYQEQVVRLLSNQSGSGGFTLRNITTVTGTPGGTAKLIPMKDANGTEGYVPWYPSYS